MLTFGWELSAGYLLPPKHYQQPRKDPCVEKRALRPTGFYIDIDTDILMVLGNFLLILIVKNPTEN